MDKRTRSIEWRNTKDEEAKTRDQKIIVKKTVFICIPKGLYMYSK